MKKLNKIIALIAIFCMVCVSASAANLTTETETKDGSVTVNFYLDSMPSDLTEIAAITIRLKANDDLTFVRCEGASDKLNKNLNASKNIIWYASSKETSLIEEDIEATDGLLYKMIYSVDKSASGTAEIEYELVEITDFDVKKSNDVSYTSIIVDLGEGSNDDGNTDSGNTDSGNTDSGNTDSGNTDSGNTDSGNTDSGNTDSGNTDSGNTDSGNTDSGNTSGGNTSGGNTSGGNTSGGNTSGGNTSGGNISGGNTSGGNTSGGSTSGGSIGGSAPVVVAPNTGTVSNFKGFSDIPADNWGYKHAYSLMTKGIVSGDGGEMPAMRPADLITRQEAAKIALLAKGIQPEEGLTLDFKDSDKIAPWAYPYIATAVKYGLLNGFEDGTVGADKFITREQMLTILGRAMGWNITAGKSVSFADSDDISAWSMDSIAYAAENGIMNGYDDNTIRPKANITRIETFALVDRCLSEK